MILNQQKESLIGVNKALNQIGMLLDDHFNGTREIKKETHITQDGYVDDFEDDEEVEEEIPEIQLPEIKKKLSKEETLKRMAEGRKKYFDEQRKLKSLNQESVETNEQKEIKALKEALKKEKEANAVVKKENIDDFNVDEEPEEEIEDDDF